MATAAKSKTLSDLRALHDKSVMVPNRIKVGIAKLAALGPENWEYEADFMKIAAVSPIDMRDYRESFKDHWADMPSTNGKRDARRVWFATKKAADAWKGL